MNYLLYGNGGSGNHGCEAIVRGTVALLKERFIVHAAAPEEEFRYGLNELAEIIPAMEDKKRDFAFLCAYAKLKLVGNYTDMDGLAYMPAIRRAAGQAKVALSVGGDNYCYGDTGIYGYLNRAYQKTGMKTVLWGCSIEPDVVKQKTVAEDLRRYNGIVARESITFHAIQSVAENAILAPDPAFFMEAVPCELDERFSEGDVVGINVSPMIIANEQKNGAAYENFAGLVHYILTETDMQIALIPHVVWDSNDDRKVLRRLYDDFNQDERLILVEDHCAPELKYIISECRFFVGARTHATIAAYSSCVPTLVVGYSVKARGIARDLFGTEEGYVLPVQEMEQSSELTNVFINMASREDEIRHFLEKRLPGYMQSMSPAIELLKQLSQ